MATYQRPPTSPVVDAQRSSRWPIVLFVFAVCAAIGGGIAYEEYVANAPIVLTPTKPSDTPTTTTPGRPSQSTSPSSQPTRPGQSKPTQSSRGTQDWVPIAVGALPFVFFAVILLIVFSWIRRARRAAMNQVAAARGPVAHGTVAQRGGTSAAPAGPWARQPGTAASPVATSAASSQPVKRKGGGFPLLPIIVGAIILDQAVFNGRYSREALAWATRIIEQFSR